MPKINHATHDTPNADTVPHPDNFPTILDYENALHEHNSRKIMSHVETDEEATARHEKWYRLAMGKFPPGTEIRGKTSSPHPVNYALFDDYLLAFTTWAAGNGVHPMTAHPRTPTDGVPLPVARHPIPQSERPITAQPGQPQGVLYHRLPDPEGLTHEQWLGYLEDGYKSARRMRPGQQVVMTTDPYQAVFQAHQDLNPPTVPELAGATQETPPGESLRDGLIDLRHNIAELVRRDKHKLEKRLRKAVKKVAKLQQRHDKVSAKYAEMFAASDAFAEVGIEVNKAALERAGIDPDQFVKEMRHRFDRACHEVEQELTAPKPTVW